MKNRFELEQKVEVVQTMYKDRHLAIGCAGVVKEVCKLFGATEDIFMYELRMENDEEEGTWPFFERELKAVE